MPSWVPPTAALPSSGFIVQCSLNGGPQYFISYGSYNQILNGFKSWFGSNELKLLVWQPQCTCDNCEVCQTWKDHSQKDWINYEFSVGRHGAYVLGELNRFGRDHATEPNSNVWTFRDLYQAAHFGAFGVYAKITDAEALKILKDDIGPFGYRVVPKTSTEKGPEKIWIRELDGTKLEMDVARTTMYPCDDIVGHTFSFFDTTEGQRIFFCGGHRCDLSEPGFIGFPINSDYMVQFPVTEETWNLRKRMS